ncbi:hypothetical protein HDU96_001603 [Phlyctochytrium bullatum]|nr:hypothetical protein HDU96_001603 [Phlyctochytrium bullatum]
MGRRNEPAPAGDGPVTRAKARAAAAAAANSQPVAPAPSHNCGKPNCDGDCLTVPINPIAPVNPTTATADHGNAEALVPRARKASTKNVTFDELAADLPKKGTTTRNRAPSTTRRRRPPRRTVADPSHASTSTAPVRLIPEPEEYSEDDFLDEDEAEDEPCQVSDIQISDSAPQQPETAAAEPPAPTVPTSRFEVLEELRIYTRPSSPNGLAIGGFPEPWIPDANLSADGSFAALVSSFGLDAGSWNDYGQPWTLSAPDRFPIAGPMIPARPLHLEPLGLYPVYDLTNSNRWFLYPTQVPQNWPNVALPPRWPYHPLPPDRVMLWDCLCGCCMEFSKCPCRKCSSIYRALFSPYNSVAGEETKQALYEEILVAVGELCSANNDHHDKLTTLVHNVMQKGLAMARAEDMAFVYALVRDACSRQREASNYMRSSDWDPARFCTSYPPSSVTSPTRTRSTSTTPARSSSTSSTAASTSRGRAHSTSPIVPVPERIRTSLAAALEQIAAVGSTFDDNATSTCTTASATPDHPAGSRSHIIIPGAARACESEDHPFSFNTVSAEGNSSPTAAASSEAEKKLPVDETDDMELSSPGPASPSTRAAVLVDEARRMERVAAGMAKRNASQSPPRSAAPRNGETKKQKEDPESQQ